MLYPLSSQRLYISQKKGLERREISLSRCPRGERTLVELSLEPGLFFRTMHGKLPLRVDCIHRREFGYAEGLECLAHSRRSINLC